MRSIILILIVGVLGLIAAIHFNLIDISQSRPAALPQVEAQGGKVVAKGGQAPAFDVATGSVEVTRKDATVAVPKVTVQAEPKSVNVPALEVKKANPAAGNTAAN